MVGLTNFITSKYVYSKCFPSTGSLPWFRAKIVEELTRAVSSMYANITKVHFLDFVSTVWNPMRWSTISVPPFVKSHSLYNPSLWQLSSFVVPNISSRIDNMKTFFFPIDDFTTYEGNSLPVDLHVPKRSNIFLVKPQSKRNWSIQPVERYVPSSQRNNRFQAINHFLYYSKFARYIIFPRIPDRLTTIRSSNECVWITCCVYSFR